MRHAHIDCLFMSNKPRYKTFKYKTTPHRIQLVLQLEASSSSCTSYLMLVCVFVTHDCVSAEGEEA